MEVQYVNFLRVGKAVVCVSSLFLLTYTDSKEKNINAAYCITLIHSALSKSRSSIDFSALSTHATSFHYIGV